MIELPLVFLGGILGSSHCLGMCGPLALMLGSNRDRVVRNVGRQLIYSLGRLTTYSIMGAAAGFAGLWLGTKTTTLVQVQAALAILAGIVLIILGLATIGVVRLPDAKWLRASCFAVSLKTFLTSPGVVYTFLAGTFTGLIPCGLVYAFLALAASTGNMGYGALTMAAFGLGTVPLMVLTGCGGTVLGQAARTRIFQIAAYCVIVTGVISIARGAGFLTFLGNEVRNCPLCPS